MAKVLFVHSINFLFRMNPTFDQNYKIRCTPGSYCLKFTNEDLF